MGFPGFRSGAAKKNYSESRSTPTSSFAELNHDELEMHMERSRYGTFELTDAIRPAYNLEVVPKQGFRHDEYVDPQSGATIPVLLASVSRERLFDLFIDLISCLGETVNVVLETSHHGETGEHDDFVREHIDMPILKSVLYDFEDLLLNDGCTGIAVVNPKRKLEVQFDEHKLLVCYGVPQELFERVLIKYDVYPDDQMRFVTEAEHVHSSSDRFVDFFDTLQTRLGIDGNFQDDSHFEM
ncbi:MAG: hypothetical protein RL240_1398 [Planctomycetota bacterium]|jgi:hypothetical protein